MLEAVPIILGRDYPQLKAWWDERGFPPARRQFLPPTGLMVRQDGVDTCGGFLFKTDARAAIIGNLVSDPRAPKSIRSEAVDYLVLALLDLAVEDGFEMVCASTNLPGLSARYQRLGFTCTDQGVSHFGRVFECRS